MVYPDGARSIYVSGGYRFVSSVPVLTSSPPLLPLSLVEQSKQYTYELDLDTLEWTKLPNGQGAEREHQNHW